ncbi:TerD family protein [Agromyces sp. NPDC057679]|uniref:TerD family protein n=1 Tax=Agromyces sp. NPDC057679 TaxID=3346207 RepID=UPI00367308A0
MTLTLEKGGNISLTKTDPGLQKALIGLGWDARTTHGDAFDLDASALMLGANGKVRSDADFIFYNQPADAAQSVVYQGDNRTGDGDGDDEQIIVDLTKVPADVERIAIAVSMYGTPQNGQNFGQVRNSYVRIENSVSGAEIVRYDLGEELSTENSAIFAELYRYNGEWKFKAIGQGYTDGLGGVARDFGVSI